jgi:hypothetical protein
MNPAPNPSPPDPQGEPPQPDDQALQAMEEYWATLQRGENTPPEQWSGSHPAARDDLQGDLRLLQQIDHARRMIQEETTVDLPEAGQVPADLERVLAPGTRVGECVIDGLLDGGGMGEVYLAVHEVLQCPVAVKVLTPRLAGNPNAVQRFFQEVQLLARMKPHPNLVTAMHASTHEGQPYLVMEYVPGEDLRKRVARDGPLPPELACHYIRQAAVGLGYAHGHQIVHRDVKPSNLMLTPDGTVKVLDLGLARLMPGPELSPREGQTRLGAILGTPDFLSPEQARNASRADARSDLYSLGCTFYYLLTGRVPFPTPAPVDKVVAHATQRPEPIQRFRPEVPPGVTAVVDRLLAKRPEDRFSSAEALIAALDALSGRRFPKRKKWLVVAAALLILALGTWGILSLPFDPDRSRQVEGPGENEPNAPGPLSGELTVRVWTPDGIAKRGLKVGEPGSLPVRNRDKLRLEVRLNQPGYVYLLWIDSEGTVTPLSPWNEKGKIVHKHLRLPVSEERAQTVVASPCAPEKGWKVLGKSGLDTVLLLARRKPLPARVPLARLVGKLPPTGFHNPHEWAERGFDAEQPVAFINRGDNRAPAEEAEEIDDPLLQLMGRLRKHFEMIRAVRFAHLGD